MGSSIASVGLDVLMVLEPLMSFTSCVHFLLGGTDIAYRAMSLIRWVDGTVNQETSIERNLDSTGKIGENRIGENRGEGIGVSP